MENRNLLNAQLRVGEWTKAHKDHAFGFDRTNNRCMRVPPK